MNLSFTDVKNSILVVDDNPLVLVETMKILNQDYVVYIAKDGAEAISTIKKVQPDLILLDCIMPEMSGFDVLTELKSNMETSKIPVILLTGLDTVEDEVKGLRLGAADFIKRPFNPYVLKLRIRYQIQIVNQMSTIRRLSITDTLTNAANRRHFNERLDYEWKRAMREKKPLSLLMLDVDHFKYYNDTYGHNHGDLILKSVANIIKVTVFRSADLVARWGGEEFAVVLPDTNLEGAVAVANFMRENIENEIFMCEKDVPTSVTVSIGVNSIVPEKNDSISRFISKADDALYRAKDKGRNRVCAVED